jgi:ubiquinone/menaquinone biosynthesis C-methylase UbiE
MYADFAAVYDRLMQDVDYAAWAAFYTALLDSLGVSPGAAVAECACGTGGLTVPLAARYDMTGIDLSEEMLSQAVPKAKSAGRNVRFVRQDMRRLRLMRPADAVLATCDGINYLLKDNDLAAFLNAAFHALKPGGALAFDISSPGKLRGTLGDNVLTLSEEDVAYIWHNRWSDSERVVQMNLSIFVRRPDGAYDRIVEQQAQRAWDEQEVLDALAKAGFRQARAWGDRRMRVPSPNDQRLHFTAIKPVKGE